MHLAPETESAGDRLDDVMLDIVLARYRVLARDYERLWGLPCVLAGSDGRILAGECRCTGCLTADDCAVVRQQAIAEALRWGEPAVSLCPHGDMLWAVPVMWNARVLGGLFVLRPDGSHETLRTQEIHRAAHSLREMAEGADLTNAALLELRRESARRESERAEAIHELKEQSYHSIRDIYLLEEPALLAAIKRGDRATAREIINRILVGIYFLGRERPQLLKSFLLELVVTMSRSAVEAGGDPAELLGANYSAFAELAGIEGEEALCAWLVAMLERAIEAINSNQRYPIGILMGEALQYMRDHLHEDLQRDEVARVACLSPSHFSRVIKQTTKLSYTDLLARLRIDRAREMLARTEKSILQVALDCGFSDQSYFTKVFQKQTGQTPGEYRRLHQISA